jgi:urea carboxylase-associated protein 1
MRAKYGEHGYQQYRNGMYRSGRDGLLIEIGKYGLTRRDLVAPVNFFSKVSVDGRPLRLPPRPRPAGDHVDLRLDMDVIVAVSAAPTPSTRARTTPGAGGHRRLALRPGPAGRRLPPLPPGMRPRPAQHRHAIPGLETTMTATAIRIRESALDPAEAMYSATLPAGEPWLHEVKQGQTLRIVDLEGNQAADMIFYNRHDTDEHYSVTDTILHQGGIYLTTGSVLMSNEGRPMLTIVADTCGRHDTRGACAAESNTVRYALHKKFMHSCRDNYLLAIQHRTRADQGRSGAQRQFLHERAGHRRRPAQFDDGVSGPGKYVELRAEMDLWVLVSNCPQLNNPCNAYNPTPVQFLIWG